MTVSRDAKTGQLKVKYEDWSDRAATLVEARMTMPIAVKKIYDQFADKPIESLSVFRAPVQRGVNELITSVTQAEMKKLGYDDIFHTGLIIRVGGKVIRLERNQTVSSKVVSDPSQLKDLNDLEQRELKLPRTITYKELFDNAMRDDPQFWLYDPVTRNCQLFVLQCIDENRIPLPDIIRAFIYQDAKAMLAKYPSLQKFATEVTNIANRADYAKEKFEQKFKAITAKFGLK